MSIRVTVLIPRDVAKQYWTLPWADLMAHAEAGTDGLRADTQESGKSGHWPIGNTPRGHARMRQGDGRCESVAFLYEQNW